MGTARGSKNDHRRHRLRAFTLGLAATAGCAAIAAASIGAGYYTAIATNAWQEPAADAPQTASLPAIEAPSIVAELAGDSITISPILARFPTPDNELAATSPAFNAAQTFALAAPATAITGTIPTPAPKPPPPALASVAVYSAPKDDDLPAPQPARPAAPRVASLGPADLKILPKDEAALPRTAVYDITAKIVYMPNGDRMEAHSGYGMFMDNPKHVHLKMRGATPPNIYRLRMRERLFHGVAAIRMLPEDESTMFRRDGILAHSYMLGPSGQSNGCISFKDYPKFLRAFQRGEVERIVVVARMDKPLHYYARATSPKDTARDAVTADAAAAAAAVERDAPAPQSHNAL